MIYKRESEIITVTRATAMIMIVLCHYLALFNRLNFISQVLNVGVLVFFLISGFLYGQKDINNNKDWILKQWKKICIPLWCYYIITGLGLAVMGKLGFLNGYRVFITLLNLQGFIGGGIGNIQIGHLWFISYILLCYLLTPLLQQVRKKVSPKVLCLCCGILIVVEIIFIMNISVGGFLVWLPGIIIYVGGYFFGAFWNKTIKRKNYIIITFIMIMCMILRVGSKYIVDMGMVGNIMKTCYNNVISIYTHCGLAIWIFLTIYFLGIKFYEVLKAFLGFMKIFERYSYEVYIVHYMFVSGSASVFCWIENIAIATGVFIICVILYSLLLQYISDFVMKKLNRDY